MPILPDTRDRYLIGLESPEKWRIGHAKESPDRQDAEYANSPCAGLAMVRTSEARTDILASQVPRPDAKLLERETGFQAQRTPASNRTDPEAD